MEQLQVRATISTAELRARLDDPTLTIVDVRPLHAYNGWRQGDEARGGHVPGAVAFPRAWLGRADAAQVERLLSSKQVVAGRDVVLYGSVADVPAVESRLVDLGHTGVRVYEDGWAAWAADEDLPVERLPSYERLVHVEWLSQALGGQTAEAAPEGRFLLFHVNFGAPDEYEEGHLPGALHLDTNLLESPADWQRRSPEELDAALGALGVAHDTTVIVYGRDTEGDVDEEQPARRAGHIAACRAALILSYAGVEDVRLLDGGYGAWVRAGKPIETTPREPTPIASFGVAVPQRPEFIVDIEEAKRILDRPDTAALVSVRTWGEHVGQVSGYSYIGAVGRIAGDVWGNCGSDAYDMQHYRNADNTMRAYPEIAADWADAGITPDKWIAFYCGTGWRASEAWFYASLMGWQRIAVYDGGWYEWSRDPISNPIEVGKPDDGPAA